jgi:hypothetical protein
VRTSCGPAGCNTVIQNRQRFSPANPTAATPTRPVCERLFLQLFQPAEWATEMPAGDGSRRVREKEPGTATSGSRDRSLRPVSPRLPRSWNMRGRRIHHCSRWPGWRPLAARAGRPQARGTSPSPGDAFSHRNRALDRRDNWSEGRVMRRGARHASPVSIDQVSHSSLA